MHSDIMQSLVYEPIKGPKRLWVLRNRSRDPVHEDKNARGVF
jgi:hypothetical protein